MSRYNIEPLESFRLSRCQIPTTCYICGHDNLFDAERCRTCFSPLAMARSLSVNRQDPKLAPQLIATFGPHNCGKTVFLGMLLDVLSRQREQMEFSTCDSASVALQQETVATLARGEFPMTTDEDPENWRWAHCRLRRRSLREPLEVFLVDGSGKSLLRELESPGFYPLLRGLFTKSQAVIICADVGEIYRGEKDQEFFAMRVINHLIEAREREEYAKPSAGKRTRRKSSDNRPAPMPPVAIVLTKADEHDHVYEDPRSFAQHQMPSLWDLIQSLESEVELFPVSAVAKTAVRRNSSGTPCMVPLRIEPRNIIEPFRWLLGQNAG